MFMYDCQCQVKGQNGESDRVQDNNDEKNIRIGQILDKHIVEYIVMSVLKYALFFL